MGRRIRDSGIKVTPQRLAVLETIIQLANHPTASQIIDHGRNKQPNIAVGTIYTASSSVL